MMREEEGEGAAEEGDDPGGEAGTAGERTFAGDAVVFTSWTRLCETVTGPATHYRYCGFTSLRRRWREGGKFFPLSADEDLPDFPAESSGHWRIQLYERISADGDPYDERCYQTVQIIPQAPHIEVQVHFNGVQPPRPQPQEARRREPLEVVEGALENSYRREDQLRRELVSQALSYKEEAERQRDKKRKWRDRALQAEEGTVKSLVAFAKDDPIAAQRVVATVSPLVVLVLEKLALAIMNARSQANEARSVNEEKNT